MLLLLGDLPAIVVDVPEGQPETGKQKLVLHTSHHTPLQLLSRIKKLLTTAGCCRFSAIEVPPCTSALAIGGL